MKISNPVWPILLICGLGTIVYSNTFHSSFHFDDRVFIQDNLAIRSLPNFQKIWNFMPCRFLTFYSFALDYHFHKLNVTGFHIVNLAIHIISALLVWRLVRLTLSTPAMKNQKIAKHAGLLSLLAGLIFVSHPVQTEAVTYIWQRTASMAAMFYLASLCFYVKARSNLHTSLRCKGFYISSFLLAIAAMFTKETSITLPLMALLFEYYFFSSRLPKVGRLYLLTLLVIPLTMLFAPGHAPQDPINISQQQYLMTQFRVMLTYLRLLFWPINQDLDYDYPISHSFWELPTLASFLIDLSLLYTAWRLYANYRLISFSILWFFLTLAPESSFLPLQDVIFEHRLYLPMAGYAMFLVSGMFYLVGEPGLKSAAKLLALVILVYASLAYQRNLAWRDELTLLNDTVKKSPHKARVYNNRGLEYYNHDQLAQALADFSKAIELKPDYVAAYDNRGVLYSFSGNLKAALADFNKAVAINPKQAEIYINRSNVYAKAGLLDQAMSDDNRAIGMLERPK